MKKALGILIFALCISIPSLAHAVDKGKSLRYGGGGQGTVIFDGKVHAREGFDCKRCHDDLFGTRKKANITIATHFTDKSCFSCHDNKTAPKDCASCHRKVASNYISSSNAMAAVLTMPLDDDYAMDDMLKGKYGGSMQSRACLSCHGAQEAALQPHAVTERGKSLNLLIDKTMYQSSTHGNIACTSCHIGNGGAESFLTQPHKIDRPAQVNCQQCHSVGYAAEIDSFQKSNHAQKLKEQMTCTSCHDPHNQVKNPYSMQYAQAAEHYNAKCLSCHDDSARMQSLGATDIKVTKAAHSFIPKWDGHNRSVMCVECHTPMNQEDSHMVLAATSSVRECAACHTNNPNSLLITRASFFKDSGPESFSDKYVPAMRANSWIDGKAGSVALAVIIVSLLHGLGRAVTRRKEPLQLEKEFVYPGFVRVCHWINAAAFIVLICTGLSIRFQDSSLALGFEGAVKVHNVAGIILALNFVIFLIREIATGDIRQYLPKGPGVLGRIVKQARYYLFGVFRNEEHPFEISREKRFNPLQQITYLFVFILGMPLLILSGILMLLPESVVGARETLSTVHYVLAIVYILFLIGHVYLATTGVKPFSLIKGMFTGMEEREAGKKRKTGDSAK